MRKPRIIKKDVPYHVVARVNRREFILETGEIKNMFLWVVLRAKRKYRFSISNFCIMGNHIHLIITPGSGESLSKIMQWILSVFAVQYNKKFGYCGHVWYDRFKSKIVEGLSEFLHAFRYIAENPVRAGMVRRPWEYNYNGITFIRKGDYRLIEAPNDSLKLMEPNYFTPLLLT